MEAWGIRGTRAHLIEITACLCLMSETFQFFFFLMLCKEEEKKKEKAERICEIQ